MNNESLVVNNKYCIVKSDKNCRFLIKENDEIDFESIIALENSLEEQQDILKLIKSRLLETRDKRDFYTLLSICSLFVDSIIIKLAGFKEATLAPLTVTVYSTFNAILNAIVRLNLKNREPLLITKIEELNKKIEYLKEKAHLEEKEILVTLNSKENVYQELRCVIENLLQGEEIKEEKHLVLHKKKYKG